MDDNKSVPSESSVAQITWNIISDDGLHGWVSSTEEAEKLRWAFEAQSGTKYVIDRRSGMWKTEDGKDWDENVKFYVERSKGGRTREKDKHEVGEEEMAVDQIEQREDQLQGQRLSEGKVEERVMAHRIRFKDTVAKDVTVPYDGVPFCTLSRFLCACIYGSGRESQEKVMEKREKKRQQKYLEKGIPPPKRRESGTRKVCCPAVLSMKKVIRFPEYKVIEPTPRKFREMSERLRALILSDVKIEKEIRVYIQLPKDEDHANHELARVPKKDRKKIYKYYPRSRTVTLDELERAYKVVQESKLCLRTPMLHHVQALLGLDVDCDVNLKLENMQKTGSFKVRGLANQLANIPDSFTRTKKEIVTMSAGNYGKAFSFALQQLGLKARVLMPDTAPQSREDVMRSYDAKVERIPSSELQPTVDRYVSEHGMHFLHPFDDINLICGHGSAGFEILEDVPDPDVILVCCGGGGLLAGIAAAVKLSGKSHTRIYGVEPEQACLMYLSMKHGKVVQDSSVHSIASGLAPPYAGSNAYRHVAKYVDDILLLSEAEIKTAVSCLYQAGLVVEPAGAAAFGALLFGKVPDISGKKVVVVITGGNVSPEELCNIVQTTS